MSALHLFHWGKNKSKITRMEM